MVTICIVNAPQSHEEEQKLFQALANLERRKGLRIIGGDFNCTLMNDVDRSHFEVTHRKEAQELRRWLSAWSMMDTLEPIMVRCTKEHKVRNFRAHYHMYTYGLPDGTAASSRLN